MMHKFKFFEGFIENTFVFDDLNMYAMPVQRGERPLRARWTRELEQDLTVYHGIDAEAELTRLLSEQMVDVVDNEIVRRLTNILNFENETDEEVLRGIQAINDRISDNDEIINEITRRINGGNRA